MSEQDLKAILDQSTTPEIDKIRPPHMPVGIFRDEVNATLAYIAANAEVRERLLKTRVSKQDLDERIPQLIRALDEAQRQWNRVRVGATAQEHVDTIARAERLRADVLAACEYNTADDRVAVSRLRAIRDGDGLSDLIDDLGDLKVFVRDFEASFEADELSDVAAMQSDLSSMQEALNEIVAQGVGVRDQRKATRDHVWTLALNAVRALRAGGRRAFHSQPVHLGAFRSSYEAGQRRRVGQGAAASEGVSQPSTDETPTTQA